MKIYWIIAIWLLSAALSFLCVFFYLIFKFGFKRFTSLDFTNFKQIKGSRWEPFYECIKDCHEAFLKNDIEDIILTSFDGLSLHGYYVESPNPTGRIVLAFHGFHTSGKNDYCCMADIYLSHGIDMLIVDQRAHGKSEGKYITFGAHEKRDAVTWLKYIENRFPEKRVYLHGISMGAVTAMLAIGEPDCPKNIAAVIADCGYTSAWDILAQRFVRWNIPRIINLVLRIERRIVKLFAKFDILSVDTRPVMAATDLPILFFHGEKDDFVPVDMSRENHSLAKGSSLVIIEEASHGTSFLSRTDYCVAKLYAFIDEHK